MRFLNKMERKFGRYAIPNLPAIIIACYVAGYTLAVFWPQVLNYLTLDPYAILHGEVWRLVTWLICPPSSLNVFTVFMLLLYYSLGKTLERTWGSFRFNVYIFGGIIFTVIGAFILYFIFGRTPFMLVYGVFSTYYVNMSIFLATAAVYPNLEVLLYFLIPIKMKWMGLIYVIFIVYDFISSPWLIRMSILASLLNFVIFFLSTRNYQRVSPKEIHRKQKFAKTMSEAAPRAGAPRHRCAVCGRTELDDPRLEFRYCSKCDGDYEYCQDHLFTHQHIKHH